MKYLLLSFSLLSTIFAKENTTYLKVDGMQCSYSCAGKVTDVVQKIEGVKDCSVDFSNKLFFWMRQKWVIKKNNFLQPTGVQIATSGKPSTWFPPGRLVEHTAHHHFLARSKFPNLGLRAMPMPETSLRDMRIPKTSLRNMPIPETSLKSICTGNSISHEPAMAWSPNSRKMFVEEQLARHRIRITLWAYTGVCSTSHFLSLYRSMLYASYWFIMIGHLWVG
mgnify:CR=1 FL=1